MTTPNYATKDDLNAVEAAFNASLAATEARLVTEFRGLDNKLTEINEKLDKLNGNYTE